MSFISLRLSLEATFSVSLSLLLTRLTHAKHEGFHIGIFNPVAFSMCTIQYTKGCGIHEYKITSALPLLLYIVDPSSLLMIYILAFHKRKYNWQFPNIAGAILLSIIKVFLLIYVAQH